jgi:ubiquinone/menaquinone biosynthesis C-methylase UbiE
MGRLPPGLKLAAEGWDRPLPRGGLRFAGMSAEATKRDTRRSQSDNTRLYDRVAPFYRTFEPIYLIFPPARRKAVAALKLKPGDVVLEIGAGTGRNFSYLAEAVGPSGTVIGVDASPGMLAEARKLVERRGWSNVVLLQQDASRLRLEREVDAVLFSLSYSAMPEPRPALAAAWERLRRSGRVVVMDLGLTEGGFARLLAPIARLLLRFTPGDPYSDPWSDLAAYGAVETERFLAGLFYVSFVEKGAPS